MHGRRGVVPLGAVYVGRAGDRDTVIAKYRAYLLGKPELLAALPEQRGRC